MMLLTFIVLGCAATFTIPTLDCRPKEYTTRDGQCCPKCHEGSNLKINMSCTTTSDTVCEPLEGFFCLGPTENGCVKAQEHTRCKPGQYIRHKAVVMFLRRKKKECLNTENEMNSEKSQQVYSQMEEGESLHQQQQDET